MLQGVERIAVRYFFEQGEMKTGIKRKRCNDYEHFPQEKVAKRRRSTTTTSTKKQMDHSSYEVYRQEKKDVNLHPKNKRLILSARRQFINNSPSCTILSLSSQSKLSTRMASTKRPRGGNLDDSIEEAFIEGKPASKRHRIALSDSLQEDFYLTDDEYDTDSDCNVSAEDIFATDQSSAAKHSDHSISTKETLVRENPVPKKHGYWLRRSK